MAEQYDNNMRFALFKNTKTKETQPDYTGNIVFDGKEFRMSGWIRTSKGGVDYLSGTVSEPMQQQSNGASHKTVEDMKDEVPF